MRPGITEEETREWAINGTHFWSPNQPPMAVALEEGDTLILPMGPLYPHTHGVANDR
jgi:hypothetical protein